jgi:hypothetical protein
MVTVHTTFCNTTEFCILPTQPVCMFENVVSLFQVQKRWQHLLDLQTAQIHKQIRVPVTQAYTTARTHRIMQSSRAAIRLSQVGRK